MDIQYLEELFAYDDWANHEALKSIQSVAGSDGAARRFFGHIVTAERIWFARLASPEAAPANPWPEVSFEEADAALSELRQGWRNLLAGLTPEKLGADLVYRNTKGAEFRNPTRHVLMQVITHSAYHRGQVAAAVRQSGGKPAATDYIVYVRQRAAAR
jgi:uncharacterized damage-inducible protein DinB